MAKQTISTGTAANDGTGDTLRGAGIKINANFDDLYGGVLFSSGENKTSTSTASVLVPLTTCDPSSATFNLTLPDGSVSGTVKLILHIGTSNNVNVVPTSSNIRGVTTQIQLQNNESVMLVWYGTKWSIIGGHAYGVS